MLSIDQQIGLRIRQARETAGLSRVQLGLQVGRGERAIMTYERGQCQPPSDVLAAIGDVVGHRLTWFFEGVH